MARLFLVSLAALYVQIMLIRWVGTELRIFAYFQNLVLIACFLGFGLGCYWSGRHISPLLGLLAIAVLVALVEAPLGIWQEFLTNLSNLLALSSDVVHWGLGPRLVDMDRSLLFALSLVVIAAVLLLLVATMVPLGQWVGYYLERARSPIVAYSVNLVGSVAGLWLFAVLAYLYLAPVWWFAVGFLLYFLTMPPSWRVAVATLLLFLGAVVLLRQSNPAVLQTHWSPYQKLEVESLGDRQYRINVNDTAYMTMANPRPGYLTGHPDIETRYGYQSSYDAPFRFAKSLERLLIVGAGAGNDAAAALRYGAHRVDAVEIDPVILSLGERLHPERPYDSPRVHKVVNDARAYLRQTREQYDVIVFGLLDSHTQFSDFSNMRIDNYVYTKQAFHEAKARLKEDGILILRFEVRPPWRWLGQRFYHMLTEVFDGRSPLVFYAPPLGAFYPATVFITSLDPGLWERAQEPKLAVRCVAFGDAGSSSAPSAGWATTAGWCCARTAGNLPSRLPHDRLAAVMQPLPVSQAASGPAPRASRQRGQVAPRRFSAPIETSGRASG